MDCGLCFGIGLIECKHSGCSGMLCSFICCIDDRVCCLVVWVVSVCVVYMLYGGVHVWLVCVVLSLLLCLYSGVLLVLSVNCLRCNCL